jgi:hypothetical protein
MNHDAGTHYREALRLTEVQLWVEQTELHSLAASAPPAVRHHIESEISRLEHQADIQRKQLEAMEQNAPPPRPGDK